MTTPLSSDHRRAILLLSIAASASAASVRVCDPMLPELGRLFSATQTEVAHVISGFAVAYGLVQAFFGPLGDRLGKFRLIALTTLGCTLGSLGAAFATSLPQLIAARVATGVAAAGIIPLAMAWIGDTVPYEQRQTTLARYLVGQVLGVVGGQFIGGVFSDTLGWRWAFGFLALVYLGVGALLVREYRSNTFARNRAAVGAVGGGMIAQARHVLGRGWARVVLLVVFLEGAAVFGALSFVPSHLSHRFGLDLTSAGAVVGLFGAGGLAYILLSGSVVRRLGEVGLSLAGGAVLAVAWAMLAVAPSWGWALPGCFLTGLGYYLLHNTLQTNATQMAPEARGTAVSLFASCFFLGQSAGVAIAAPIVVGAGAPVVFAIAAVVLPLVGAGFAALLRRRLGRAR